MNRLFNALCDVALSALVAGTALLGVAASSGCGTSPTSSPSTYHDFLLQQNQINCEARFRCCGAQQCTTAADQTFNLNLVSTQKLLDAGKIRFDPAAAQTCLDSGRSRTTSCDIELLNQPTLSPTCAQVLVGTVDVGQACNISGSNNCVANAYCDTGTTTCRAFLADGTTCGGAMGGRCKTTSFCDTMALVCKPLPKAGESCATGGSCDTTGERLVCAPTGLCSSPLADGTTCTTSAQCKSNSCGSGTPRICVPAATPPQTVRDSLCRAM